MYKYSLFDETSGSGGWMDVGARTEATSVEPGYFLLRRILEAFLMKPQAVVDGCWYEN